MFGDADRAVFLDSAVFGVPVTSGVTTATGVLSIAWMEEQDGSGLPYKTQRPTLTVERGVFARPALDATVWINGVEYVYRGLVDKSEDAIDDRTGESGGLETWLVSEVS
jgi:hypothetical protein